LTNKTADDRRQAWVEVSTQERAAKQYCFTEDSYQGAGLVSVWKVDARVYTRVQVLRALSQRTRTWC